MKTHKQYMEELKIKDAQLYNEIQNEAAAEIAEIKKVWGGKRKNAGRKPRIGTVLKFSRRLTEKENKFIDYVREHNLDVDQLMDDRAI